MELALEKLEKRLSELFSDEPDDTHSATLQQAARYTLFAPSKRLRPLIVLSLCPSALDVACAIECIHTYSLIHDDLPCMDNDPIRRSQRSLHIQTSEWLALLTGDYLLTRSFEILARSPYSGHTIAKLIRTLSHNAGLHGMIGGQVADMTHRHDKAWTTPIQEKKTGKLFEAAFEMGGIAAKATPDDIGHLKKAGLSFGTAFQIQDDLNDNDHSATLFSHSTLEKTCQTLIDQCLSELRATSFNTHTTQMLCQNAFLISPSVP